MFNSNAEFFCQHGIQPDLLIPQDAGGLHRVEEVGNGDAKTAFQADEVVLGRVKHFFHFRIAENGDQGRKISKFKRIDQEVVPRSRKLDQAELFTVGVETIRFGINGNGEVVGKFSG